MLQPISSELGSVNRPSEGHTVVRLPKTLFVLAAIHEVATMLIVSVMFMTRYLFALSGRRRSGLSVRQIQGRCLFDFLAALGPVYVKVGQILATRTDLVPPEWVAELRRLQDAAPRMSRRQTVQALRALDHTASPKVTSVDEIPIACASIAQVHRGRLSSGETVAIKIIKTGVRRRLFAATTILGIFAKILHLFIPAMRRLEVSKRFAEVSRLLRTQTDLTLEAHQQQRIRSNFKGHAFVRVPRLYSHLCTADRLVMEFVEAIPGTRLERISFPKDRLARRFQDVIYTMLYLHGVGHGDPHPGNIMFTQDGEVILLDFGITVELTEDEKWGLSSFYYAAIRKEWRIAATRFIHHFVQSSHSLTADEEPLFFAQLQSVLIFHFQTSTNRWSTIEYFRSIEAVLHRHGLRYTTAFTKVELVFLSCEGFATQIDPRIDIWANARAFSDRYSPYMSPQVQAHFDEYFGRSIPTSISMRERAQTCLVAPTHMDRYFFPSAYPLFVREAHGGHIIDVDGNSYIDLSGGYGPHYLGYRHPDISAAIEAGVARGFVNALGNEPELELSRMIVAAFCPQGRAILCNSGTEAVLLAIRLCRAFRKRPLIAKFEGHYHGFSDQGMVSSWFRFRGDRSRPLPIAGSQGVDPNVVNNTLVLQYGEAVSIELLAERANEIACVICEPMPSSTARSNVEFVRALRAACTDNNLPLIFDEVVTGFRVTYGGAQTLLGVLPDLTCLGKVIGGGLPCGCVVGRPEFIELAKSSDDPFYDYENRVFAGGTMSGNSLTCSAGLAALEHLKNHPHIYDDVERKTQWLAERLASCAAAANVACNISASHSIFSINFSHRETSVFRDKLSGSNFKATIALAYYMRKHGVYLPELHSFLLSAAHTYGDLEHVGYSFCSSLSEMTRDGLFVL